MRAFAASLIASIALGQDVAWTSGGTFKVKNAAFPTVTKFEGPNETEEFLMVSSFGALSSGYIYMVDGIKDAVATGDASNLKSERLNETFVWPNEVKVVDYDIFGERAIQVPDGFLVPGKTEGGVYILRMDDEGLTTVNEKVMISPKKKGFFYHMGYWVDMNGDGRKDFITARSNAKAGDGELVWFEHPEGGLDVSPWEEHVVTEGPDVGIEVYEMPGYRNELIVFAAEFFDENLSVYRVSLKDGTLIESRVIDDTTLAAYSVELVDLNNDGKQQLLVNNHEKSSKKNGIWAYELPSNGDLFNGEFTKKTIETGFNTVFSLIPAMSPGFPYAVWPHGKTRGERAHIFVAGDGDYEAHVLVPTGDNAEDFGYTDYVFDKAHGTVGALAFSDLDNDGWTEVWVPNYDKSTVELYKFSEGSGSTQTSYFNVHDFVD